MSDNDLENLTSHRGFFQIQYKPRGKDWTSIFAPTFFNVGRPSLAPEAAALEEARKQIECVRSAHAKATKWRIIRYVETTTTVRTAYSA